MESKENNFAYIDGANLHKGVSELGWELDYRRFRIWLGERYGVKNAYIFIGFIGKHKGLYTRLQEAGFILMYKEVSYDDTGKVKGNCDAALVLKVATDYYERKFHKAVIVSGDGDYAELIGFLKEKDALRLLISPNNKCSYLLRKQNIPLLYLSTQRRRLENNGGKEKAPGGDGTPQGSFS